MKILKAKIRGLGETLESDWFDLSSRLNLFNFSDRVSGTNFLRTLQTINPPYSCHALRPFSDFPHFSKHRGYIQRISPQKRTVAMAVFDAPPELVNELAVNSELLYETDRIEVGRRLDYSRWINFVELPSSTRWSEIAADIDQLLAGADRLAPPLAAELQAIAEGTDSSDRIKRELKDSLAAWLDRARKELGPDFEERIDTTREAVLRADYFHAARATVYKRLPLFAAIGDSSIAQSVGDMLHWLSIQAQQLDNSPAASDNALLNTLNEQLSLVDICSSPLHVNLNGTTFSVRTNETDATLRHSESQEVLTDIKRTVSLAIALSRTIFRTEPI
ncbi:MAG: hypothetical protein ACWGOX_13575, partial [Desulforhopalus sp.]